MKVLFDHQIFISQNFGGASKCFCELVSHFPQNIICEIGIKQSNNIHLHDSHLVNHLEYNKICFDTFITKNNFKWKRRLYNCVNKVFPYFPSTENINKNYAINLLKKGNYDVFHPTFFDDYYLPFLNKKPFVLTIHDMIPELFPEYFNRNDWQIVMKQKLVHKATAIVAVSEQTKSDLVRLLNVDPNKVSVIYHGGPKINKQIKDEKPIIEGLYILYVGMRGGYKNFSQFLKGYAQFHKIVPNVKLVCTGKPFSHLESLLISELNLSQHVISCFVDDKQIANLYAHALTFVYPSLYEGFGMPILEAFSFGCPTILSNCSCFPEIAGDAALYFDPKAGEEALCNCLVKIYNFSNEQRDRIIQLGYERLSHFSWYKSSMELAQLYESLK